MKQSFLHYNACPVCGSNHIYFVLQAKDHTVSGNTYNIFECGNCTLRFTQEVPDVLEIGKYYKSDQYISHSDTNKGFINKLYHIVRKRTLKQKVRIVQKATSLQSGTLLDIGTGTGAFAAEAAKQGWDVSALEPDADAREVAKEKFNLQTQPSEALYSLPDQSFDAITLWHVLEHVHALHEYVAAFGRLLRNDGMLLVAVPNYTSFDAKKYTHNWAAYDVPRHLYHFSPQSMQVLMEMHSMQVVKMLPMPYDSYYVSMLSEQYKSGRQNILKAFINGFLSNQNAGNKAQNYSSVIYLITKKLPITT